MRKTLLLLILCVLPSLAVAGTCPSAAVYPGPTPFSGVPGSGGVPGVKLSDLGISQCYFVAQTITAGGVAPSDSNTGADELHPWLHIPGMSTWTGTHVPIPGDGFIFKGNDVWNGTNLGDIWSWAGTATNPIYIGVDKGWFSGASWSRPVWSCGGQPCGGATSFFLNITKAFVVVDNLEFTGLLEETFNGSVSITTSSTAVTWVSGPTFTSHMIGGEMWLVTAGTPGYVISGVTDSTHLTTSRAITQVTGTYSSDIVVSPAYLCFGAANQTLENAYIHGWAHGPGILVTNSKGFGCINSNDTMRYTVWDGSDTSRDMLVITQGTTPIAYGNYFNFVQTALDGCGDNWHDNLFEFMAPSVSVGGAHQDALYQYAPCNSPHPLMYNNVVRHTTWPSSGGAVKFWMSGNNFNTATGYAFNNVIYDNAVGNIVDTGGHFGTINPSFPPCALNDPNPTVDCNYGTWNFFNNTVQCGVDATMGACVLGDAGNKQNNTYSGGYMTLLLSNNHWIDTPATSPLFCFQSTWTCPVPTTDLNQLLATANGPTQGYSDTTAFAFQPTVATGSTVGHGTSTSSLCTTISGSDAGAGTACTKATTYAVSYSSTTHSVSWPALTPVNRGTTDIGAYQFSGTATVATPTFTPPAGAYSASQTVTISTTTSGSSIVFCQDTTNTCTPTQSGTSVVVNGTGYLRAFATHTGFQQSATASAFYQIGIVGNAGTCPSGIQDQGNSNFTLFTPFTVPAGSGGYTLTSEQVCITSPAAATWGLALYADNAGSPGALLCNVLTSTTPVTGYNTLTPSGCGVLTNGAQYWLGHITASNTQGQGWTSGVCPNGVLSFFTNVAQSGTTFPSPAGATSPSNFGGGNCYLEAATITPATGSAPLVSLTPTNATFSTNSNTTSVTQTATLTNIGNANLIVTATGLVGPFNNGVASGVCIGSPPYTIAPGQLCIFNLTFSPTSQGLFTGSFSVTDNASGSPHTVALSGKSTVPVALWSSPSFAFGNVSTSSPVTQSFTLFNTGNGPMAVNLSTSDTHFTVSSACGTTLAPCGQCNVQVTFTPTTTTSYSANLIETDLGQGISQSLAMTGTGVPSQVTTPAFSLPPGSYPPPQSVSLNDSTVGSKICFRTDGGTPTASVAGTCDGAPTQLYSSPITVNTTETITAIGTLSGSANSPVASAFYNMLIPTATLGPDLTAFSTNINTTSPGLTTTLTNTGPVAVVVTQAQTFNTAFTITNSTDPASCFFKFGSNTSFSLPVGQSCNYVITFTPTTQTTYTSTFQVTDNATGSPQVINLSGQGTAPAIVWSSPQGGTTYNFGNVIVGTIVNSSALTLSNTGTGPLNVALTSTGANAARFSVNNSLTTCTNTLAAGLSCNVVVSFNPTAAQSYTAFLTETDSVQSLTANLTLNGTGIASNQIVAPFPSMIISLNRSPRYEISNDACSTTHLSWCVSGANPSSRLVVDRFSHYNGHGL